MVTTGIHRKKGKKQDFDLKIPAIILALRNCIRYVLSENEKNFVQILKLTEGFRLDILFSRDYLLAISFQWNCIRIFVWGRL
jgi:hypothetical protein